MKKHFIAVGLIVTCFISFAQTISAQCANEKQVNSVDYAPYLFYKDYEYIGEGHEFAGQTSKLIYPINEDGIYQFRIDNSGVSIVYVYQITDEGIYELAYFPDEYGDTDYRQHEDTLDDLKSLVLPKELKKGENFLAGYSEETELQVVDILAEYQIGEQIFNNVVVLKIVDKEDDQYEQYFYYAAKIGFIGDRFVSLGESKFEIMQILSKYDEKIDLSSANLTLCQEDGGE